jgi:hypothetical protein
VATTVTPGKLEQIRLQAETLRDQANHLFRSARLMRQMAAQLESMVAEAVEPKEGNSDADTQ